MLFRSAWCNPADVECLGFEDGHSRPSISRHQTETHTMPLFAEPDELLHAHYNACRELANAVSERDRLRAEAKSLTACYEEARAEAERANVALKLYRTDRDFAHRLAVMLECVLLGGKGTWDAGHTLLDEYREACRIESNEVPTFMGEPVTDVRANVQMCPRPINTGPDEQTAAECIANGDCGCIYGPDRF